MKSLNGGVGGDQDLEDDEEDEDDEHDLLEEDDGEFTDIIDEHGSMRAASADRAPIQTWMAVHRCAPSHRSSRRKPPASNTPTRLSTRLNSRSTTTMSVGRSLKRSNNTFKTSSMNWK